MATGNLFKRAAAYRKKHKNLTQAQAVQAVSKMGKVGKKVVGPVKKKVAGTKKKTVRRKRVGATPVVRMGRATKRVGALSGIQKTKKLLNEIESLETQRRKATKKELRDVIQLEINARHDKVDQVKRAYRR